MTDAPPTTVEDMFVQTASGVRTDGGTMTLLGLTPHTIYFSDRPQRIVGHLTTHRFLQWWSEGDDSFAVDPPNAVLAWGEPGTDTPEEAVVVISDPSITADGSQYHVQTLQGTPPATAGPCVLFIDPLGGRSRRSRSPGYAAGTCAGTAAGCSVPAGCAATAAVTARPSGNRRREPPWPQP
jgi:hypothetical protein